MRRAPRAGAGAVVVLLAVVALVSTSAPRAEAVPELQRCDAAAELVPGSFGPDVLCLQFALLIEGIRVSYNGIYDQPTQDGVRWFQATHPPLRADGLAGEQTLEALGILAVGRVAPAPATLPVERVPGAGPLPPGLFCLADATVDPGERGESVTCLQRTLAAFGFYRGSPTGHHDAASQEAVRAFQRQRPPLAVDGYAGPRTLAALGIWSGITIARGATAVPRVPGALPTYGAPPPGPFPAPVQAEPLWSLTAAGVPSYGDRTACTRAQADVIAAEFARDGADAATQQWAVYVASREGGCRHDAVNVNPATRDDSHCTFQLNVLSGMFEARGELGRRGWTPELVKTSLGACADAASDLWVFCGRGPWTPPYSCRPPWEGATPSGAPLPPTTTTTTIAAQSTATETTAATTPPLPPVVVPPGPGTPVPPDTGTTTTTTTPVTTTAVASLPPGP